MRKRKIKYSKLVLIGIFIYIIANILGTFFRSNIETKVVSSENVEESINSKGLLIRDEYIITSGMSGNIEVYVNEGDRVKKKDKVAYIYNNNIDKETIRDLDNLKKEVINIQEGNTSLVKADVDKVNLEIDKNKAQIQGKLINGNTYINKEVDELERLINDKNDLLKSDLNSKSIKNKEDEINKINNKIDKNSETLKTDKSGIVSYKYDGNESKFNIENILDLKVEDIENATDNYTDILKNTNIKSGQPVARIINSTKQYLVIAVEKNKGEYFEKGNSVVIRNGNNSINAKIYEVFQEESNNIVVFEISEQNIEINGTRVAEFDIIYKSIEGLKIPKKSLVKEGNKQGVYIISETGNAKFVEIKGISYENEEFIVIDYYKNKINGVKTIDIYDEIILEPNKVKSGSIVK